MRKALVRIFGVDAGLLEEKEDCYEFRYFQEYVESKNPVPISLLLPVRRELYRDKVLFPFFDGLIPEGWLLDIAVDNWKLDIRDRMGLLLACCRECIGAVSIVDATESSLANGDDVK